MTGRTGYTGISNTKAPDFGADVSAVYAYFDALTGESVANAAALPTTNLWVGRRILLADTGMLVARTSSGWVPMRPNVGGAALLTPSATNVYSNQPNFTPLPVASDAAALQQSFTKYGSATKLMATVSATAQLSSGVAQNAFFGLRINGVDYPVAKRRFNDATDRQTFAGTAPITGAAAGTYNVLPVFRGGPASLYELFSDDSISWSLAEVV